MSWQTAGASARRFRAAFEAAGLGLVFGLIDVHSSGESVVWFLLVYLSVAIVLGVRHGARSWQAWIPLGASLFLAHLAAIACGYKPPYVEANAREALAVLFFSWPAAVGLALGATFRLAVDLVLRSRTIWRKGIEPPCDRRTPGDEVTTDGDGLQPGLSPIAPARASAEIPRRRFTVWRLMVVIAVIGVHLAFVRLLLLNDPFFGLGTIYSQQFSEERFRTIQVGMTTAEVEAVMGPPLRKVPWGSPSDDEMWFYSEGLNSTANFWRRWLLFQKGKVSAVIDDFWED